MTNWDRHKEQMLMRQERPQPTPEPKGVAREMERMRARIAELEHELAVERGQACSFESGEEDRCETWSQKYGCTGCRLYREND